MKKKEVILETIDPKKGAAMEIVCICAFYVCCFIAVALIITAGVLPVVVKANAITCWICMGLEAACAAFSYIAYWIKKNAM